MLNSDDVIELLELEPLHGEGGMFRQTYVANERYSDPSRYPGIRAICTAIYYLLTDDPDSFSAVHRLPSDEIWHFYLGDPVEMLLLDPEGAGQVVRLGSDLSAGQQPQLVVPAGIWQGARLVEGGNYALMGTTMAPGYDDSDYDAGTVKGLIGLYPQHADLIRSLTRR